MSLVALLRASPNALVLVAIAAVLLLYAECNRPGTILPGAAGLALLLMCAAALFSQPHSRAGLLFFAASAGIHIVSLRHKTHWSLSLAAGFLVYVGCRSLLWEASDVPKIRVATALLAGLLLGPGTSLLTAIARRARLNKGLDSD